MGISSGKAKAKGNSYERKVAKELSFWIFEDQDVLKRHPTSGADKCIWCGDIVPLKQLPLEWNAQFPFMIETKSGYEQHSPTFWRYGKIEEWVKKAYIEGINHNQTILFLICQFKNKSPLLITNYCINIDTLLFNVVFPVRLNGNIFYAYVYNFKDVLKLSFCDLFNIGELCGK